MTIVTIVTIVLTGILTMGLSSKRRSGETLIVKTEKEEIRIHFKLDCQQIKLTIDVPRSVKILRGELLGRARPVDIERGN